ncbi:hypothetical protein KC336_g21410 [Hortaea werneckii]|nr:hypothetical protein KC336_g21410 [Hortaea werneckii]
MDDRMRRGCRGVDEDAGEMGFEDDEFDMGLSEGMDEFSFEDDEHDGEESEEMGEDDSQDGESWVRGKSAGKTDSETKEDDATGLSEDTKTIDSGDDDEGPDVGVIEGGPGESMGPYAVETGWVEEAESVLEDMTPALVAEAAGPASDGVVRGTSDTLNVVPENGFGV